MNFLQIILGQLPETIYFAIFMILTKRLQSKRILFTSLMILEYLLLLNILPFSTWAHVLYFAISYIILKILYKDRAQITDIFTMGIASITMMIISAFWYFTISVISKDMILCAILAKITMCIFLYFTRNKLYKIQKLYKRLWNRNDKIPKKMKSATFRCVNVILFNIMFYIINAFVLFSLLWR